MCHRSLEAEIVFETVIQTLLMLHVLIHAQDTMYMMRGLTNQLEVKLIAQRQQEIQNHLTTSQVLLQNVLNEAEEISITERGRIITQLLDQEGIPVREVGTLLLVEIILQRVETILPVLAEVTLLEVIAVLTEVIRTDQEVVTSIALVQAAVTAEAAREAAAEVVLLNRAVQDAPEDLGEDRNSQP